MVNNSVPFYIMLLTSLIDGRYILMYGYFSIIVFFEFIETKEQPFPLSSMKVTPLGFPWQRLCRRYAICEMNHVS